MDNVTKLLEQLANKLGVAVEYLWTTLIKQQYVEGITNIILSVFGVFIIIFLMIYTSKFTKRANDRYRELKEDRINNGSGHNGSYHVASFEEDKYFKLKESIPTYSIIVGSIVFVLTAIFIVCGIQQLLNPNYFALKDLLSVIGS